MLAEYFRQKKIVLFGTLWEARIHHLENFYSPWSCNMRFREKLVCKIGNEIPFNRHTVMFFLRLLRSQKKKVFFRHDDKKGFRSSCQKNWEDSVSPSSPKLLVNSAVLKNVWLFCIQINCCGGRTLKKANTTCL